jgi:hypothetical protein
VNEELYSNGRESGKDLLPKSDWNSDSDRAIINTLHHSFR